MKKKKTLTKRITSDFLSFFTNSIPASARKTLFNSSARSRQSSDRSTNGSKRSGNGNKKGSEISVRSTYKKVVPLTNDTSFSGHNVSSHSIEQRFEDLAKVGNDEVLDRNIVQDNDAIVDNHHDDDHVIHTRSHVYQNDSQSEQKVESEFKKKEISV